MAFFDIFKKKQDTPPTGEQAQKQQEELSAGLEKTKTGLFSKLARAVAGRSTVDADVLDDLEEVLISSDVGVETTVKIIRRIEERVARDKYMNASELQSILRGEQGGEKVLIYHVTGEKVPEGKLPLDVGAVVLNCTTISSIARYCRTGLPLVKKCVTVDGSAVKNPMNVLVPIGMRMKDVFEATGGFKEEPKMVLYGGPMMGIAVPDLEQPILKNTNAILAFGEAEATPPEPTACIKCGKCIAHCPLSLMPCEMETAYKKGNIERLMHLKVNLCMECGCCSFICPAHRPLVQTNKLAKAQVMAYKNALKAKAEAEKQKEAAK